MTSDLTRDVDTDARVTSVTPIELVIALDAAPHTLRVVFPGDVTLTVHAGDALHVTRRTRRIAGAARHDLVVSDAAGMLVLAISDSGDPTLLPGWEIRAATDTPGTRFDHTARRTTVLESEWRRLDTRDGAWQLLATGGVIQIVRTE